MCFNIVLYFQDSLLSEQTICNTTTSITDDDKVVQFSIPHVKDSDTTYTIEIAEKGKSKEKDLFIFQNFILNNII